jgi:hypothetical protein
MIAAGMFWNHLPSRSSARCCMFEASPPIDKLRTIAEGGAWSVSWAPQSHGPWWGASFRRRGQPSTRAGITSPSASLGPPGWHIGAQLAGVEVVTRTILVRRTGFNLVLSPAQPNPTPSSRRLARPGVDGQWIGCEGGTSVARAKRLPTWPSEPPPPGVRTNNWPCVRNPSSYE